jgi:cysteine desulfurase
MTVAPIYLDYQATTPLDSRALDAMIPFLTTFFGNPSSSHTLGRQASIAMESARGHLRDLIGAQHDGEIVFTSGATEADHLAIVGTAAALREHGDHIVTTAIEHKAVLAACELLAADGYRVTHVPVDRNGIVNPADIEGAMTRRTVLVSVMHANNEIGSVQPLREISTITRERGVLLHADAAQGLGTLPFDVDELGVDLASFSAHKIYGPKGSGALYIRRGIPRPVPQLPGGGQEFGMRAGTQNVAGIAGFGTAAAILRSERSAETRRVEALRTELLSQLRAGLPESRVNGSPTQRLAGNISITVPGIDADELVREMHGLAISTGSACSSGYSSPSHVLTAIGLSRADARATLRISIGRPTTGEHIDSAAAQLIEAISRHLDRAWST